MVIFWVLKFDTGFPKTFESTFFEIFKNLHHGPVGRIRNKECYFTFAYTFLAFFCCFSANCYLLSFLFVSLKKYQQKVE